LPKFEVPDGILKNYALILFHVIAIAVCPIDPREHFGDRRIELSRYLATRAFRIGTSHTGQWLVSMIGT
jgi:hypothetical protein